MTNENKLLLYSLTLILFEFMTEYTRRGGEKQNLFTKSLSAYFFYKVQITGKSLCKFGWNQRKIILMSSFDNSQFFSLDEWPMKINYFCILWHLHFSNLWFSILDEVVKTKIYLQNNYRPIFLEGSDYWRKPL